MQLCSIWIVTIASKRLKWARERICKLPLGYVYSWIGSKLNDGGKKAIACKAIKWQCVATVYDPQRTVLMVSYLMKRFPWAVACMRESNRRHCINMQKQQKRSVSLKVLSLVWMKLRLLLNRSKSSHDLFAFYSSINGNSKSCSVFLLDSRCARLCELQ